MSDKFRDFIAKTIINSVYQVDTMTKHNIKYGYIVSGLAWVTVNYYVEHIIKVPKTSAVARIYENTKKLPFGSYYNYEHPNRIYFAKADNYHTERFASKEEALNTVALYKPPHYTPDGQYQYYKKYIIDEEPEDFPNSVLEIIDDATIGERGEFFTLNSNPFKGEFPFNGENHVFSMEYLKFRLYNNEFMVLNTRSFFHEKNVAHFYETVSEKRRVNIQLEPQYEYQERTALYLVEEKKLSKIFENDKENLDVSFLEVLRDRTWEKIFTPEKFSEIFTETVVHDDSKAYNLTPGSVILVKNNETNKNEFMGFFSTNNKAAVYLGEDEIIEANLGDEKSSSKVREVYKMRNMRDFIGKEKEITEIKFKVNRFDIEELRRRMKKLNKNFYGSEDYNPESLAFYLATGMFYSSKLQASTISKIFGKFF